MKAAVPRATCTLIWVEDGNSLLHRENTPKGGSRLRLNRPDEAGNAYSRTCRNRMRLSWRGNGTVARKGRRRSGAAMAVRFQVLGAFVYVDDGAGEVARTGHRLETPGHMHAGFQSARMSFRTVDAGRHDRCLTWMRIWFIVPESIPAALPRGAVRPGSRQMHKAQQTVQPMYFPGHSRRQRNRPSSPLALRLPVGSAQTSPSKLALATFSCGTVPPGSITTAIEPAWPPSRR